MCSLSILVVEILANTKSKQFRGHKLVTDVKSFCKTILVLLELNYMNSIS